MAKHISDPQPAQFVTPMVFLHRKEGDGKRILQYDSLTAEEIETFRNQVTEFAANNRGVVGICQALAVSKPETGPIAVFHSTRPDLPEEFGIPISELKITSERQFIGLSGGADHFRDKKLRLKTEAEWNSDNAAHRRTEVMLHVAKMALGTALGLYGAHRMLSPRDKHKGPE